MSMEDLIQAMMGGGSAQGARPQQEAPAGDPLAAIMQALLGGGQAAAPGQMPAQGGMEGLPAGAGGLGDILGAILGGAQGVPGQAMPGQAAPAEGMGGLGDILGAILGGAQAAPGQAMPRQAAPGGMGGLGDILGAILGGGAGGDMSAPLAPMVNGLAAKLGLPPAIAQMVVSFVLSKLFSARQAGGFLPAQPVPAQPGRRRGQATQPAGLNLDDLLNRMGSEQGVDAKYLKKTGMPQELAAQTGLDHATATQSLQEIFNMLSSQGAAGQV